MFNRKQLLSELLKFSGDDKIHLTVNQDNYFADMQIYVIDALRLINMLPAKTTLYNYDTI